MYKCIGRFALREVKVERMGGSEAVLLSSGVVLSLNPAGNINIVNLLESLPTS